MVNLLSVMILLSLGGVAEASTYCIVNRPNATNENQYDRNIFAGVIESNTNIVIETDGTVLDHFNMETDLQEMADRMGPEAATQILDGAAVVTITTTDNHQLTLSTERFDFSKHDNSLPMETLVFGDVDRRLTLMDGRLRLSVSCAPVDRASD